ncbi:hypothetical protein AU377_14740 [Sporosarcina sp. HYO08]|nr:hypothetical protein AU377_14740 [Sporosarcina sp. HYO08]
MLQRLRESVKTHGFKTTAAASHVNEHFESVIPKRANCGKRIENVVKRSFPQKGLFLLIVWELREWLPPDINP